MTSNSASLTPTRQSRTKRQEIADALSRAALRTKHDPRPDFKRHERKRPAKPARLIAYDLETTNIPRAVFDADADAALLIGDATPRPLYITAYSLDFECALRVRDMTHLHWILTTLFLTPDNVGAKFVGWNQNRFDAYFIAAALLSDTRYRLRPYMTRSKALRGLRVELAFDDDGAPYSDKSCPSWEFVDGIAMTGLAGFTLEKFLANFAPDHPKLSGIINFEAGETFDPDNEAHRRYAMQDSVGLFHGISRAQEIMLATFNEPLAVTMGGVCIKIFQAHIPRDVVVQCPVPQLETVIREFVTRGGYCYCVRRYTGPVWKYDLNQAYAAAMREADMPCGSALRVDGPPSKSARCFVARIEARYPGAPTVPFYFRTLKDGRIRSVFSGSHIADTWVTSIEYAQLRAEGWDIRCIEHWRWGGAFSMAEYVDKLETLRTTCEGGPSGAIGTMVKGTGNHSFGKTLEKIEPIEYIIAAECPDDCVPFYGDGADPLSHVFYRMDNDRKPKAYHQPQLGAWITSHCRMVLRRAALLAPDAWVYADTDCVVFTRDVTDLLDVDPKRYGAWKVEEAGTPYRIIAKKVYAEVGGKKRSAKGMHVRRLSDDDFERWAAGEAPVQDQAQVNNFLSVLCGAEMFRAQHRKGTRVEALQAPAKSV